MKQLFQWGMIVSLIISGLLSILILLIGDMDDTQVKIIFTSLSIAGFSITGFCNAVLIEKMKNRFGYAGILSSVLAFIHLIVLIWFKIDFFNHEWFVKLTVSSIVAAVATAHISLMLLISQNDKAVKASQYLTIASSIATSSLIISAIFAEYFEDAMGRAIGIFSVLTAVGTVVTPILNRLKNGENVQKNELESFEFITQVIQKYMENCSEEEKSNVERALLLLDKLKNRKV